MRKIGYYFLIAIVSIAVYFGVICLVFIGFGFKQSTVMYAITALIVVWIVKFIKAYIDVWLKK